MSKKYNFIVISIFFGLIIWWYIYFSFSFFILLYIWVYYGVSRPPQVAIFIEITIKSKIVFIKQLKDMWDVWSKLKF